MQYDRDQYKEVSILLIEDDDVDAMGVHRALKTLKIVNRIVRAKNGLEALELLRSKEGVQRPFIILLDLNMPKMNGLEFLGEMRQDESLTDSIVFVLTTSQEDRDKMAAYEQHIAGYIVKNNVGDGFLEVMEMLDRYWRVVELPVSIRKPNL